MDINQVKLQFESSKENLLQIIIKNGPDLDSRKIAEAIKEFVQNHERYNVEKKRALDLIAES